MNTFKEFVEQSDVLLSEDHKHLLPSQGALVYKPPRNCHNQAQRVRTGGKETYVDARGMHWQFDFTHTPHWDVRSPNNKSKNSYVRVGVDGRIWEVYAPTTPEKTELLLECGIATERAVKLHVE